MASASLTIRCEARVCTISLSTVRTSVLCSSRFCSCCAASNYHTAEDTPDKLDYDRMAHALTGLEAAVEDLASRD